MNWTRKYNFLPALVVLFMTTIVNAQSDAFSEGNAAYETGHYEEAKDHYKRLVADEKMSASLFYNLGNCYYQLDELGEAIWAYESALKINPGHENARFNLEFSRKQTYDNLTPESSDVLRWFRGNIFVLGLNFWSWISVISLLIFCFFLYLFFTTSSPKTKNYALTFGFLFFGIVNAAGLFAMLHKRHIVERESAIIIEDSIIVRTSPSDTAKEAFNLHEGTKIDLERSNEDWVEISVNGNTGWVLKEAILEI